MNLSPNYPANCLGHLGNAYRLTGKIEEAITAFKANDAPKPRFWSYRSRNRLSGEWPTAHARSTYLSFLDFGDDRVRTLRPCGSYRSLPTFVSALSLASSVEP